MILKIDFRIVKNIVMDRLVFPKLLLEVFRCNISISHVSFVSVLVVFEAETGFSVLFSYVLYFENIFYRTMLVHSERIIYTYAFTYTCSSMVLDTLRIYHGPFSNFTCWWYKFSKNFSSTGAQFGFNLTILIRVSNRFNGSQKNIA